MYTINYFDNDTASHKEIVTKIPNQIIVEVKEVLNKLPKHLSVSDPLYNPKEESIKFTIKNVEDYSAEWEVNITPHKNIPF